MFVPYRCKNPPESFPWATYGLILANLFVYVCTSDYGLVIKEPIAEEYGLKYVDANAGDALSSLFLHGNLFHLLGNMWFLHLFGSAVEGRLRWFKFLIVYLASGVAGDALQLLVFGPSMQDMPTIGASGAIMGLMGASLYMFPYSRVGVFYGFFMSFGVVDWHLRWVALFFVGMDAFQAFMIGPENGVANLAHLGGIGGGFLAVLALRAKRDADQVSEVKATIAETRDYSVLPVHRLEEMAGLHPQDTLIALHWLSKAQRDPAGPSDRCRRHFFVLLERMIREQPPEAVASALMGFFHTPREVPPKPALDLAIRLEGGPMPEFAMQLYDLVLRGGRADEQDQLMGLLRGGILSENRLNRRDRAVRAYEEVLRRDPIGPMGAQARHRLDSLKRTSNT